MFTDRKEAGRELAAALMKYKPESPVVLAIPRGGVPVGLEVALALEAPLDIIVARKLGAPGQHELGLGAIVDGDHPQSVLNEDIIRELGVSPEYLQKEIESELKEIRRRQAAYRKGRPAVKVAGRTVIVVDDGIATGGSIRAALRGVKRMAPKKLVLAVPVAPSDTIESLRSEADELVCLDTPVYFMAIGEFYEDFSQTSDHEVIELLETAAHRPASAAATDKIVAS
ncbi:MAG: phosphoribosyltransferase [Candidatus Binataceae bacterium]